MVGSSSDSVDLSPFQIALYRLALMFLPLLSTPPTSPIALPPTPVLIAQVTPDTTLGPEPSIVTPDVNVRGAIADRIDGGAIRGPNLFHSFSEFNIDAGDRVYFSNPIAIDHIFSRVTGANPSNIFGTLGVDGPANLFLLNPNGILFGENASLDIEGSFVGTTTSSLQFADGAEFSALTPAGGDLLTVSVPLGLQYGPTPPGSTITNRGTLQTGADFELRGDRLDLQGQLFSGGDLTLLGTDSVQIRDAVDNPFIAASLGEMVVQGDRLVDIFALNHPSSGLYSGGDMTLRSANPVGGDAHYWSGGSFLIEGLGNILGQLYSPNDPVIFANGDIAFNGYTGQSLHIFAGGSVVVPGTIIITGPDNVGAAIVEDLTLSDNTTISIDGGTQPTLDIRAGIDWGNTLPGNIGVGVNVPPNLFQNNATNADILIGNIILEQSDGLVLLTNQYQPNGALDNGTITIAGDVNTPGFVVQRGIEAVGAGGNGSLVVLDARDDIRFADGVEVNTSAISNIPVKGGDVRLIAENGIELGESTIIITSPPLFINIPSQNLAGGNISLEADEILLGPRSLVAASRGGNIRIQGERLSMQEFSSFSSFTLGAEKGGDIQIDASESVFIDGANIGTILASNSTGEGGRIEINTGDLTLIGKVEANPDFPSGFNPGGDITSDTNGAGDAGTIAINANQVRILNGSQIRASTAASAQDEGGTNDAGNAGNIVIRASDFVEVTGITLESGDPSKIATTVNPGATGNGGELLIETGRLIISNGAQIQAGALGTGDAGSITINARESVDIFDEIVDENPTGLFTGTEGSESFGNGGDIGINAGILNITGEDSIINAAVDATSQSGDAGATRIEVNILNVSEGARITTGSSSAGQGGPLTISASESITITDTRDSTRDVISNNEPSAIVSATIGRADGGDIEISTGKLTIQDGSTITASTFGGIPGEFLGRGGNILINATESIEITGESANGPSVSSIRSESGRVFNIQNRAASESRVPGGNITITTGDLKVEDNATISTATFGGGNAGGLDINASGLIRLRDGSLNTRTNGGGNAGDLNITTAQLVTEGVAEATTATEGGTGSAGNLSVFASDSIQLSGVGGLGTLSLGGGDAGDLSIRSGSLTVKDGAGVNTASLGRGEPGDLAIIATDFVEVVGGRTSPSSVLREIIGDDELLDTERDLFFPSRITTESATLADNPPGNLTIQTSRLTVLDGAEVTTQTLGDNSGGSLDIIATEKIEVVGQFTDGTRSTISAQTIGDGNGGDIRLETPILDVRENGIVSASTTRNTGQPGSITIENADVVNITDNASISTSIGVNTIVDSSNPDQRGNIDIQTQRLLLSNDSQLTASTLGQGDAGSILVRGAEEISIDNSEISSLVASDAIGDGGEINLQTASLMLSDRATITSSTSGIGDAGEITINASESIALRNNSQITTAVEQGAIGDADRILLQTPNLSLRNDSLISAASNGTGNPGTIRVRDADRIFLNDSRISTTVRTNANAEESGNITLHTNELILTNDAAITATTAGIGNPGVIRIPNATTIDLNNSRISTAINRQGRADTPGEIIIGTRSLSLTNAAAIIARTRGQGDAGRIRINATDRITLDNGSQITTAVVTGAVGDADEIVLFTPILALSNNSIISAETNGEGNAGSIRIPNADRVSLNNSQISTSVGRNAIANNPGSIQIDTDALQLTNESVISASTNGQGGAGAIQVGDANTISLDNSRISTAIQANAVAPDANPGNINLQSQQFNLTNGSIITATTAGQGSPGQITLQDADTITLDNSSISTAVRERAFAEGMAEPNANTPGSIRIGTQSLQLTNGADITASTNGEGSAGRIQIQAIDQVMLDRSDIATEVESEATATEPGLIDIDTGLLQLTNGASITASTAGNGDAGAIVLDVEELAMGDRSQITSQSTALPSSINNSNPSRLAGRLTTGTRNNGNIRANIRANAGDITITVANDLNLENSDISTQSTAFAGGEIAITADTMQLRGDGDIRTNVASGADDGGDITLTAAAIIAFDDSDIVSSAAGGTGGNITLNTPAFFGENLQVNFPGETDRNDRVDINATGQVNGTIATPDVSFIQNSLNNLPESVINTETIIANSCVVQDENGSTFLITGSGGLQERPEDGDRVTFPTGDVQPIPEPEFSDPERIEDAPQGWQPGDPIIEAQEVYQLPNGELIISHTCF